MLETAGQPLQTREDQTPENRARIGQGREWILSVMARANEIACAADTSGLVQGILDLMMQISLADSANFFELDPATDELVITHVRGDVDSQYLVGMRLNRQQGLPGIAFCDTRIVVVGDLPSEPDWLHVVDPVSAAGKKNRTALSTQEVLTYLRENAGILFDAECVRALDQVLTRPESADAGGTVVPNGEQVL